ncbi:oxidoreductase domain-containing protein [Natrialba hulunbeirensis JCM 10989]|uniref:Oxidoreductase domain-containing protein n=1 Tax=Natrialba hulunbeirensis JCM 10989 TaxID=1227493 RepID=L9ZLR3_9EURY|nr:Gfo/Idh/MocA family oxidoreductase [Natrialba hulunbeirensis]ELY87304.1 oxidoreductase domain-containing protein [Natrialba hulunbeirensis JCM 10989]
MTVKTAVVGAGTVSEVHLSGIDKNPRTELVGICDLDIDRAREAASRYDITPYGDIDDLLAQESLDWLHICTSVQSHLPLAKRAIDAGVPLLIEKPVTETIEELEELEAYADEHDVPVSPVHQHNFDPVMRTARRMIHAGELGEIRGVDLIYTGLSTPDEANRGTWVFDLPGGEFEEGLPHPIYSALRVSGFPESEESISSTTRLVGDYDDEFAYDSAQLQYVTEDDVLCSLKMLSSSKPRHEIYVHGTEKSIQLDMVLQTIQTVDEEYHLSSLKKGKQAITRSAGYLSGLLSNAKLVADGQLNDDWETAIKMNAHYAQFDRTARAIEAGTEMPVSLESSKWTIRLIESLRDSSTTTVETPATI